MARMRRAPIWSRAAARTAATLVALSLWGAACGSQSAAPGAAGAADDAGRQAAAPAQDLPSRPLRGIAAANGIVNVGAACEPGSDDVSVGVAYVGPDLAKLREFGLETLVLDDPVLALQAYVYELNAAGGTNGHCIDLTTFAWSAETLADDFARICAEVPRQQPVVVFSLGLPPPFVECLAIAAELPVVALFETLHDAGFTRTRGRVLVDTGSVEHLVSVGLHLVYDDVPTLDASQALGLLQAYNPADNSLESITREAADHHGAELAAVAEVPAAFGDLALLNPEYNVRLLFSDLDSDELEAAIRARSRLDAQTVAALDSIEGFYLDTAARFDRLGIGVVVGAAPWQEVRRLMRAAQVIGWHPTWLITDAIPASVLLTDNPADQAGRVLQVGHRSVPGDDVSPLDRECFVMRNTSVAAEPFSHRVHTDAWNMLTTLCNYLDVVMAAISRISGTPTPAAFLDAMNETEFETPDGGAIRFDAHDPWGAEQFRLLAPDLDCLLDEWGCMRASSKRFGATGTHRIGHHPHGDHDHHGHDEP